MLQMVTLLIRTFTIGIIILVWIGSGCQKSSDLNKSNETKVSKSEDQENPFQKYILPSPSQLFNSLERIKKVNWIGLVQVNKEANYSSDMQMALNIGARTADGIVLVYAGDLSGAKEVWGVINELSSRLTIDQALEKSRQEVKIVFDGILEKQQKTGTKTLDNEDKKNLRQALDHAHVISEKALKETNNRELALFLSLGGWIEGLYLVSQGLSINYDEKSAKVLRVSALIETFESELKSLSQDYFKNPIFSDIVKAMPELISLTKFQKEETLNQDKIKKLFDIAKKLKISIEGGL